MRILGDAAVLCNDPFYRFRQECDRARIKILICVGIMPFTAAVQTKRMVFTCGASIPSKVGGAVFTPEYARMVGAGCYAADVAETVRIAGEAL